MARPKRPLLIPISIALHVVIGLTIYIVAIWRLERLDPARVSLASVGVFIPSPPGGSPPAGPAQQLEKRPPTKIVEVIVQPPPTRVEAAVTAPAGGGSGATTGTGTGIGTGSGSGSGDGDGDGTCLAPPCDGLEAIAKLELPKPKIIPPTVLATMRISGETQIEPGRAIKDDMEAHRRPQLTGVFEICITEQGTVAGARLLASTNYPDYDARLADAMQRWRYRPYTVDGRAMPACGTVTFIYKRP